MKEAAWQWAFAQYSFLVGSALGHLCGAGLQKGNPRAYALCAEEPLCSVDP